MSLSFKNLFAFSAILACINAQYHPQQQQQYQPQQAQYAPADDQSQYNINKPPPPQILSHKQALNHDGAFKYIFTSENGLAQGESIAPDGTRSGGYSYTDPTGRKISVKYTAGKDGFRILEGDHLPRAPQPLVPQQQQQQQPQTYVGAGGEQQYDDGQYRPQLYEQQQQQQQYYPQQQYLSRAQSAPQVAEAPEPQYNDEPGKAHSFGAGYNFEFAG